MHFVKKTADEDVPEEERTAKERKRAAKLLAFTRARDRVFEKRMNGEYDEEIMTLSGELLAKNPDIYTLWNVRREAVDKFCQQEEEDESPDEHTARLVKLFDGELALTQECLLGNPKSYSSWHHRFLMLGRHPRPELARELAMCERALAADCRNFHCWDHRRAVARMARLSDAEELEFSDRLIGKNPSNYSAWHYRGTLLPRLRPNMERPEAQISDQCLAEEFEKVLHVCGVNSEDQTAWTYCRWLVEVATAKTPFPQKLLISARFVDPETVQFVFAEAVDGPTAKSLICTEKGASHPAEDGITARALSRFGVPAAAAAAVISSSSEWQHSHVWLLSPVPTVLKFHLFPPQQQRQQGNGEKEGEEGKEGEEANEEATMPAGERPSAQLDSSNQQQQQQGLYVNSEWFQQHFSPAPSCTRELPRKCLHNLIALCNELIPEEDNPWELAALTRATVALDGVTEATLALAVDNCRKLQQFDSQRASMYAELLDQLCLLHALNGKAEAANAEEEQEKANNTKLGQLLSGASDRLLLSQLGLTILSPLLPLAGLVRELNLQNNQIPESQLGQLSTFASLSHLTLDGNPIRRLPPLHLPRLEFLSLARTRIRKAVDIQSAAAELPRLQRLVLCETELAREAEEANVLREELFRGRNVRLIFHWMV